MDRDTLDKARLLHESGRVRVVEETEKNVYLEVEGEHDKYDVRVASDRTVSCTCPFWSVRGAPRGAVCSHVIAALLHLTVGPGRPGTAMGRPRKDRSVGQGGKGNV